MFSEQVAETVLPMVVENGAGKHVPSYRFEVDLSNMTWGDNMIQVKFQLLIETAGDTDGTTSAQRKEAYRQLMDGFNELTEFLDRVVTVYRDGAIVSSITTVPMHAVREIMDAIRKAQADQGNSKN